jgi:diguanylate cyclase (GGDEF)-like protein/PAS domain S-box-containing protein
MWAGRRRRRTYRDQFLRSAVPQAVCDERARLVEVNPALEQLLDRPAAVLAGRPVSELSHPSDTGEADAALARLLAGQARTTCAERILAGPGGAPVPTLASATALEGGAAVVYQDLTALRASESMARRLEEELRAATLHDPLTGLANRALLFDRLQHALTRETTSTAVLFVDLDHFRGVNDERGNAVGDEVLAAVAQRLVAAVRPSDTVGRLGADEFVVVCEDADAAAGEEIANRLLYALRPAVATTSGNIRVGASIGVAATPTAVGGSLLRHAETATYAAKAAGRGRVQLFDAAVAELARQRFELGVELGRAIAADELHLHYQPIVDLGTGDVVGAEALARWDHPRLGPVPPDRFVAVAEAEGLTGDLDRWVVCRALAEGARLVPEPGYVAVNLSARTLADPGLKSWVRDAAGSAGLRPERVVLEVTESATMADPNTSARVLEELCGHGFRIAVDDFGTGHSSLAYLRRLPVTTLKIDRSFVAELTTDAGARAITGSIIELARTIGLTVVAEGVETTEQVAVLRALGATSGQGWLWSPAVSSASAGETFTRRYDV